MLLHVLLFSSVFGWSKRHGALVSGVSGTFSGQLRQPLLHPDTHPDPSTGCRATTTHQWKQTSGTCPASGGFLGGGASDRVLGWTSAGRETVVRIYIPWPHSGLQVRRNWLQRGVSLLLYTLLRMQGTNLKDARTDNYDSDIAKADLVIKSDETVTWSLWPQEVILHRSFFVENI